MGRLLEGTTPGQRIALARQFENEANPAMHERTTGREIVEDFKGEKLDYWVTGFGTGGTLTANRLLRHYRHEHQPVHITVVDQDNFHVYQPGLLFVPFGLAHEQDIVRPRGEQPPTAPQHQHPTERNA